MDLLLICCFALVRSSQPGPAGEDCDEDGELRGPAAGEALRPALPEHLQTPTGVQQGHAVEGEFIHYQENMMNMMAL